MKRTFALLAGVLAASRVFRLRPSYDPKLFSEMRWRSIGPLRGGRTKSAAGVASQPNVFYIGVCNGGVWKTTDYGRTWNPIFDDQPTGSIGAVAVAPSDPNIIYVGSGEGLQRPDLSVGDGVYKSTDAGKTWTHLGLRDGQQIPQIAVDPRNPDRLFVAVLGHPYGPNAERGLYRSTDGGADVREGPRQGREHRRLRRRRSTRRIPTSSTPRCGRRARVHGRTARGPARAAASSNRPTAARTWKPLTQRHSPERLHPGQHRDRAEQHEAPVRVASRRRGGVGIYRSDDAGEHWARATTDPRPAGRIGGGDLSVPAVDPKNPDIVYVASTVAWKSIDGGKTWTGFRGAPGGDDYQRIWINPNHPNIILLVSDQGAIITRQRRRDLELLVQPADRADVPRQRRQRLPVSRLQRPAGERLGLRLEPRQRRPDHVPRMASGGRRGVRLRRARSARPQHRLRRQGHALRPPHRAGRRTSRPSRSAPPIMRTLRTAPVVFSQADPHVLFFAANTLWKTADGGNNWKQISPDLTRKTWELPASIGKYRDQPTAAPAQRGVIYAVAPVAARHQSHLGRHRRRPDPHHRRWRPALEGRHAARSSGRG